MMSISFPKSEQDKFRRWTKEQSKENQKKCKILVADVGMRMHKQMQHLAQSQTNTGYGDLIRGFVLSYSNDRLGIMVHNKMHYAPYLEFGTGKRVRVFPGYESFAWQFKGRGIKKINIKARPFFINTYELHKKYFMRELNKMGFNERPV